MMVMCAHLSMLATRRVRVARRIVGATPQLPPCCIAAGCSPGKPKRKRGVNCARIERVCFRGYTSLRTDIIYFLTEILCNMVSVYSFY